MRLFEKVIGVLIVSSIFILTGCDDKGTTTVKEVTETAANAVEAKKESVTHSKGEIDTHGAKDGEIENTTQAPVATVGAIHEATIIEVIEAPPYDYIKVDSNGKTFWAAVPQANVKAGDKVSFKEQMWMQNFTSKTLGRTFDTLLFASNFEVMTKAMQDKADIKVDTEVTAPVVAPTDSTKEVEKATKEITTDKKINTIEELYVQADDLNNTTVSVRGKVVKVSNGIMQRNWIHIQDGSGSKGDADIVFTSATQSAEVGDEVIATGTLNTNIDFGYGYVYSVIVQESTFEK